MKVLVFTRISESFLIVIVSFYNIKSPLKRLSLRIINPFMASTANNDNT